MLDKFFWDYFKNTGSIDAYLGSKDYDKFVDKNYNNEDNNNSSNYEPLHNDKNNTLT